MRSEPNRIREYFPEPRQSVADRLLQNASVCKIEMVRLTDSDEPIIEVQLTSTIEGHAAGVLAALVAEFHRPRDGGKAVSP
jgi:hypothetical protein